MFQRALVAALLLATGDASAQPVEQFFARKTITITIGYTAGGSYDLYGRMVARHLGRHIPGHPTVIAQNTRFKLISGYPASNEAMLAMERGEVEGASSSWAAVKVAKQAWLRDKKIRIILQTAPQRSPELPDAPSLGEVGNSPEDKQVFALYSSGSAIGRSVIGPPAIPAGRVTALRDAFQAMIQDPEFIAELARTNVELDPLPGAEVEQLIHRTLAVPAAVRERAKLAFGR